MRSYLLILSLSLIFFNIDLSSSLTRSVYAGYSSSPDSTCGGHYTSALAFFHLLSLLPPTNVHDANGSLIVSSTSSSPWSPADFNFSRTSHQNLLQCQEKSDWRLFSSTFGFLNQPIHIDTTTFLVNIYRKPRPSHAVLGHPTPFRFSSSNTAYMTFGLDARSTWTFEVSTHIPLSR